MKALGGGAWGLVFLKIAFRIRACQFAPTRTTLKLAGETQPPVPAQPEAKVKL